MLIGDHPQCTRLAAASCVELADAAEPSGGDAVVVEVSSARLAALKWHVSDRGDSE